MNGITTFTGTPIELEAALRQFFDNQRMFLEGQRRWEDGPSDEVVGQHLELFDRTVWEMDLISLDKVAEVRVRPALAVEAGMIDTERELTRILTKGE